jgi:hypothetical protein
MQDRPDLIESELSGLAFDSLQQVFKPELIEVMFKQPVPAHAINDDVHVFIDPAAGGPYSDYAVLSVTRQKGMITVSSALGRVERGETPLHPVLKQHRGPLPGARLIKYAISALPTSPLLALS